MSSKNETLFTEAQYNLFVIIFVFEADSRTRSFDKESITNVYHTEVDILGSGTPELVRLTQKWPFQLLALPTVTLFPEPLPSTEKLDKTLKTKESEASFWVSVKWNANSKMLKYKSLKEWPHSFKSKD